ncbi:hypothetical protein Micbo1qcDRAFT_199065 [Microdochium bolleyi]|uniref:Uncharacterized protein n=1 Tax=Microdochium bolleyi TaxID=196109 RepID=A0A136IIA8_9PEZI|nr:hypothetical protein Micbo1qcDRAFT_199065 [Microdochium bolleyi]
MMVALMLVMVGITCLCLFRVYVAFDRNKKRRGRRRLRFPKSSQGKIMTSQEFETYRQSKMVHQDELDSESDDSHDEEDVNEADERNLEEEAFLYRQRQQAYIAEQRLNRRKVSGGEGSQTPERRPAVGFSVVLDISVETWISASTPAQSGLEKPEVGHPASLAQEDDDDVPIALLVKSRAVNDEPAPKKRSPQNTLHLSIRPHTSASSRQLATPLPQPHAYLRPFTPFPNAATRGHHHGHSLAVNNASQLSLPRPQTRRQHTSGGLGSRIESP